MSTPALPLTDHHGDALTALQRTDERDLDLDAEPLCPLALVVLLSPQGTLFGLNRWRRCWELPGGMIESGETAREAAARELDEETHVAISADDLAYLGTATFELHDPDRRERAALFGMRTGELAVAPSHELIEVGWLRDPSQHPDASPIDAAIADWVAAELAGPTT